MSLPSTLSRLSPPGPGEFARYLRTETFGGVVLLVAGAAALLWANSPWSDSYVSLRDAHVGTSFPRSRPDGGPGRRKPCSRCSSSSPVLELKLRDRRRRTVDPRQAALPIIAAIGGVVVPIGIFLLIAHGTPGADRAWAIPRCQPTSRSRSGPHALVGSRIPSGHASSSWPAVVDDLIAIVNHRRGVPPSRSTGGRWRSRFAACAAYAVAQRARIGLVVPLRPARGDHLDRHVSGRIHTRPSPASHWVCSPVSVPTPVRSARRPGGSSTGSSRSRQPCACAGVRTVRRGCAAHRVRPRRPRRRSHRDRLSPWASSSGRPSASSGCRSSRSDMRWVRPPDGLSLRDMLAVSILGGIGFTVSPVDRRTRTAAR